MAAAERGQDLIADGLGGGGGIVDRVGTVDEIGESAGADLRRGDLRDVDRHQVHRDSSNDLSTLAGDGDAAAIAGGAEPAIGIADRDGGDSPGTAHTMGCTITNGHP